MWGRAEPGTTTQLWGRAPSLLPLVARYCHHWPVMMTSLEQGFCPPVSFGPRELLKTKSLCPPHLCTFFASPTRSCEALGDRSYGSVHLRRRPEIPVTGRGYCKSKSPGPPKEQIRTPPQGVPAAGHSAQPGAETGAIGKAPLTSASGPACPPPTARPGRPARLPEAAAPSASQTPSRPPGTRRHCSHPRCGNSLHQHPARPCFPLRATPYLRQTYATPTPWTHRPAPLPITR